MTVPIHHSGAAAGFRYLSSAALACNRSATRVVKEMPGPTINREAKGLFSAQSGAPKIPCMGHSLFEKTSWYKNDIFGLARCTGTQRHFLKILCPICIQSGINGNNYYSLHSIRKKLFFFNSLFHENVIHHYLCMCHLTYIVFQGWVRSPIYFCR